MVHMNHAGQGILPQESLRAAMAVLSHYATEGSLPLSTWRDIAQTARQRAAALLGVGPATIAFISSTTHGIHCAMELVPFRPGDHVVVAGAFPALVAPWRFSPVRGVRATFVEWTRPEEVLERLTAWCRRRPVRAVFVDWVHFATGQVLPLPLVRESVGPDVYLVVDAMQGLGLLPSPAPWVDLMVAGGTKWLLGPEGTGILYLNPAREWRPGPVGWLSAEYEGFSRCMPPLPPAPGARRLESGTRNTPGIAALSESLAYILSFGDPWARVRPLVERLLEGARAMGLTCSVQEPESGIVGVEVPDPDGMVSALAERGVRVSAREGWLRISPHVVNTMDHVEATLAALAEAVAGRRAHGL